MYKTSLLMSFCLIFTVLLRGYMVLLVQLFGWCILIYGIYMFFYVPIFCIRTKISNCLKRLDEVDED